MQQTHFNALHRLLADLLGSVRAVDVLARIELPAPLDANPPGSVDRATLAWALTALQFDDVLRRVPSAQAYAEDQRRAGRRQTLDHGALRTVDFDCGALPRGSAAFARLLEPLGFECRATYPLERLQMTGYAFTHRDQPATIPQFFVSELHVDRFESPEFSASVGRVVGDSRDPLSASGAALLARLSDDGRLSHEAALRLLPELVACFDRQHPTPRLADYRLLAEHSAEMAWIATEGNAFNHTTDRVEDVVAVAEEQRHLGRPVKDRVEVSASGRVLQTAFRAARVERPLLDESGRVVLLEVPGSFHEFITRHRREDGALDLDFDASNAQGIFRMTDHASGARGANLAG